MNTKKTMIFVTSIFCALLFFGFQSAPQHELLFEKAKFTMETKGDLKEAVALFQEIIAKYPQQRQVAAKSHFYIGLCYEKLGQSEAIKAYELVLEKYADQPEQVAAARARLAALRAQKPEGLTLAKIEAPKDDYFEVQAISPDGSKIVGVVYNDGQNIAVYDLVTKRLKMITNYDWSNVTYCAIWSPDGKRVAYQQYGLPTSPSLKGSILLMASTLDGKAEPIYFTEKGTPVPYDWLPDGSAVVAALSEGDEISLGLVSVADKTFKALHTLKGKFHSGEFETFADASPDGKHIVFADGRGRNTQNIYCIGTDGQPAEALTTHTANDYQPRWSPDGEHIVFLSFRSGAKALWGISVQNGKAAGEPFIIQEMGQGTNLLNWTPQGLAYDNWIDMWDVHLLPVDPKTGEPAGKFAQLDYSPPGRNKGLVWSPDGKHVAFFSADRGGQPGKGSVVVMPVEGGQAREYPIPMDTFHMPNMIGLRWMPDGSGLGFYGPGQKKPTLFRLTVATGKWETWQIPLPGWTRIEWGKGGDTYLYSRNGMKGGIRERSLETGEERVVYQPEQTGVRVFRGLKFSWDYKWLVFSMTGMDNSTEIAVLDPASGESQVIAMEDFFTFAWSADGQKLAIQLGFGDEPQEMAVLSWQDGVLKPVEAPEAPVKARCYITDWSPDGKQIAFDIRQSISETFMMKNFKPEKK